MLANVRSQTAAHEQQAHADAHDADDPLPAGREPDQDHHSYDDPHDTRQQWHRRHRRPPTDLSRMLGIDPLTEGTRPATGLLRHATDAIGVNRPVSRPPP